MKMRNLEKIRVIFMLDTYSSFLAKRLRMKSLFKSLNKLSSMALRNRKRYSACFVWSTNIFQIKMSNKTKTRA